MQIKIGFDLIFNIPAPTAMLLMLYVHPSRERDLAHPEILNFDPFVPYETFIDSFGNKVARILAPPGQLRITHSNIVRSNGLYDEVPFFALQHPVQDLPPEVLPYLLASRYCEVDRMTDLAWERFGQTPLGWPRVQAVLDFVHNHIKFGYAFARSTKTAFDVFYEQRGVCRDFMHLAVTLLRALGIPARYVTGYLGDIGIPPVPDPMDFSAWFEVYLSNKWWTCDARHNVPRIGRILMATGRDATDVAITTSFGPTRLDKFFIITEELK